MRARGHATHQVYLAYERFTADPNPGAQCGPGLGQPVERDQQPPPGHADREAVSQLAQADPGGERGGAADRPGERARAEPGVQAGHGRHGVAEQAEQAGGEQVMCTTKP
jgi:hypothetical protein